ncbi:hypothetical protein ACU5DF_01490 [Aliivibrio wodanis]|uniref:hypothetical protein n=1 Tax=Aliivibrio wodanis TaxID=80852 RepID=UPI00406D24D3
MNKNNINSVLKLIVLERESTLFELHQTYRMTYSESKDAVEFLESVGVVKFDGKVFELNDTLNPDNMSRLYNSIKYRNLELESDIINQYRRQATDIDELYNPDLSLLSQELKA